MPRVNTTIDDVSPLITYLPQDGWYPGSHTDDPYWVAYANGTFTVSVTQGATATFKFNGTGVWLYGARRGNHGTYSVTLDGRKSESLSGNQPDGYGELDSHANQFHAVLYAARDLSWGSHEIVLTNEGTVPNFDFLDLDYIVWENTIVSVASSMGSTTISPEGFNTSGSGWAAAGTNSTLATQTGIYTNVAGDSVEIPFQVRDAVELYGSIGASCGFYDVVVDEAASTTYNATRSSNLTSQLLFYGANLGSGQHTLRVTNNEINNATLVIDRAVSHVVDTSGSPSTSGDASSTGVAQSVGSSSSKGKNKALIGGLAGAVGFLFICVVVGALYLWQKRRRRAAVAVKKAPSAKLGDFDIDRTSPSSSAGSAHQHSLSEFLENIRIEGHGSHGYHSDASKSSNKTRSSSKSRRTPTPDIASDIGNTGRGVHVSRKAREDLTKNTGFNTIAPYELPIATVSNGRLQNAHPTRPSGGQHGRHHRPHPRPPIKTTARPLPVPPGSSSRNTSVSVIDVPPPPSTPHLPQRRISVAKTPRRTVRNSRILRTGYNFLFARPGQSNSGSEYAPSTVLTSEISERPATTTLSPVTEIPPALPPIRPQTPSPPRPLQITNQADDL